MPLNHYITLGRSGLRVSPLCLGAMTFGLDWGWGSEVDESCRIMDAFLGAGGNFIDTANMYTKGHSEKIIGDHLGRHPAKRDRVVIATKFLGNMYPGDPNGGGAGRKGMMAACEQSLRRLQTDYIDLYWMHFWDPFTPMEETIRALDDLVRAGKVRYIGFSDTPAWKCAQAQTLAALRGWTPVIALQIEYSLLQRTVEGELIPMAQELGLGVTPWSPLKFGALSGKFTRANAGQTQPGRGEWVTRHLNEHAYTVIDACAAIAKARGCSVAQVALAWVNARPGVQSTIIGARTMEQLTDNMKSLDVTLSAEETARLHELTKPALNFPYDFIQTAAATAMQGGATINARRVDPWPMSPTTDAERW